MSDKQDIRTGMTRIKWAIHLKRDHANMPGTPSVEEMVKYPQALVKMLKDHAELHRHFYTGHEHDNVTGLPVPGRTK